MGCLPGSCYTSFDVSSSLCAPADEARNEDKQFRKAIERRITKEEEHFLEEADAESVANLVSDCLGRAQEQQEKSQGNPKMIRRAGKKAVIFANNFSGFLQAYSGIVEIMKAADQQYGGVAYGTLSLFLVVCQLSKPLRRATNAYRSLSISSKKKNVLTRPC